MLATTIQITNNPPHTTHTQRTSLQAGCASNHHPQAADANTVLNVNPTVCLLISNVYTQPKTHPHPPPNYQGSKHMQAQENKTPTNPFRANERLFPQNGLPRKEVIQPHLPVRLPCYDFVPIANPTFDHSPRKSG